MSYIISTVDETSVTLRITPISGYSYYRIIWRLASETAYDYEDVGPKSSSFSHTITGLESGTKYTFNVAYATTMDALNSSSLYMGAQSETTEIPPAPSPTISSLTASQGDGLTIDVYARITNYDTSCTYEIAVYDDNTGKWWSKVEGTVRATISKTVSVDKAGTFHVRLTLYDSSGLQIDRDTVYSVIVEAAAPAFTKFTATQVSNTVAVYVSYGTTDWISGDCEVVIYAKLSSASSWTLKGTYTSSSLTNQTISLNSVGSYDFRAELNYGSTCVDVLQVTGVTVTITKPSAWVWTTSELNAFQNKGKITELTRTRWNEFLSWVITVIAYANTAHGSGFDTIVSSNKMGTDKILYATSFNNIYPKINQLWSTGITSNVATGDIIYGHYFVDLAAAANSYLGSH